MLSRIVAADNCTPASADDLDVFAGAIARKILASERETLARTVRARERARADIDKTFSIFTEPYVL